MRGTKHYFAPGVIINCHTGKKPSCWWLLLPIAALIVAGALL